MPQHIAGGPVRPRRSALYVPADNARALEKARSVDVDVLLFDLEDAVAPAAKEAARAQLAEALGRGGFGRREKVVRVNGAGRPLGGRRPPHGRRLRRRRGAPAQGGGGRRRCGSSRRRWRANRAPRELAIWAMIETPRGVLAAPRPSPRPSPRLACLVAGTSDLVKDLNARHTPGRAEVLTALSLIVLAARAHGLACLDGVHLDLADEAGFEAACAQGRDLGFDGKTLIHPKTVAAANRIFGPSEAELDGGARRWWRRTTPRPAGAGPGRGGGGRPAGGGAPRGRRAAAAGAGRGDRQLNLYCASRAPRTRRRCRLRRARGILGGAWTPHRRPAGGTGRERRRHHLHRHRRARAGRQPPRPGWSGGPRAGASSAGSRCWRSAPPSTRPATWPPCWACRTRWC